MNFYLHVNFKNHRQTRCIVREKNRFSTGIKPNNDPRFSTLYGRFFFRNSEILRHYRSTATTTTTASLMTIWIMAIIYRIIIEAFRLAAGSPFPRNTLRFLILYTHTVGVHNTHRCAPVPTLHCDPVTSSCGRVPFSPKRIFS